jgi:predicted Zn-dependent protease
MGLKSADWYQENVMLDKEFMHGKQADAGAIIDLLRSNDKTGNHFVVLVTDSDLTSGENGNNFIYGLSSYPYIVISARRFTDDKRIKRGGYAEEIYDEAVSLVAAHEFAHYLDLVRG